MPPKMHKKWTHRELEALSMGVAQEASLSPESGSSSGGADGLGGRHELPGLGSGLDGIFGVVPLAGSVLGIRIQDDLGYDYRSMFHFLFIGI